MALYHQLKFPSTFIEYRSVSEWKEVVVISNFDSLEAALGSCLVCLGPKFAPAFRNTHFLRNEVGICSFITLNYIFRHFRKIAKNDCQLSSCLSVRPSVLNNSAPTGRIFMKFDIRAYFEKSVGKIQVSLKSDKNDGHFT